MTRNKQFSVILLVAIASSLSLYFTPHLSKHFVAKDRAKIAIENISKVHIKDPLLNNTLTPPPSTIRRITSPIKSMEFDAHNSGAQFSSEGNSESDAIEYFSSMFVEPEYFMALRNMNPLASSLIAHHAYMSGQPISAEDSNLFFKNNPRFAFQIAIEAMCPDCLLGLLYFEKNVSGGEVSIEQYMKLMRSKELMRSLVEAANSEDYFTILFPKTI